MENLRRLIQEMNQVLEKEVGLFVEGDPENTDHADGTISEGAGLSREASGPIVHQGRLFQALPLEDDQFAAIYVLGSDEHAHDILALAFKLLKSAQKTKNVAGEKYTFLKNVLLENELPGDIPLKAREYNIDYFMKRQALLLNFNEINEEQGLAALDHCLDHPRDVQLSLDEHHLVVLLAIDERDQKDVDMIAHAIHDAFSKQGRQLQVGIGMPAEDLKDVSNSYRQANLSLIIGSIFKKDKNVVWYNSLGLGRLIYQLPPTLCRLFLNEVFAPDTYEALDPETLLTIDKFFENNLNGSETSRQLFVHRNTLVYRLDKVQKITGLDLRTFDDAVLFKLASMVREYLEAIEQQGEKQTLAKHW